MPKHVVFLLTTILVAFNTTLQAQRAKWMRGEMTNEHKSPETYLNPVYHEAKRLPDSIKLQFGDAANIQKVIDCGLHSSVYAVEIINIYRPDLAAIFDKLVQFPNLQYITITDNQRESADDKSYQIPANINSLQGLKGIELAFTNKLDMVDAFNKLTNLKQLNSLAITEYYHPLPVKLTELKKIKEIRINTLNIRDMNLSEANWETAYLSQGQQTAINKRYIDNGDDQKALLNLAQVKSLRMLDIGLYNLTDAAVLKNLSQLTGLKLYATKQLNNLTTSIAALTNLESLSIYNMDYKVQISMDDIGRLSKLKNLSITLNNYSESKTPSLQLNALRNLINLESLNLGFNNLGSIPDIFSDMKHLKRLSLLINGFTQLPESIYNLPELEYLDLSSNPLGALTDKRTYGWPKLKTLILNRTKLTALPLAILRLPALENLSVSENRISILPKGWQNLKKLKTVNLANNKLTHFNYGILDNPSIERLEIQNNNIAVMADVSRDNYSLKFLNISNNLLTNLPANIDKLHSLETLQGYNLKLQGLPASLGNCVKLKELSLPGSVIATTVLPAGLKNAANLQFLNLSGCPLIDHESIFEVLLAPHNQPINVDLSGNNISSLPATNKWVGANFGLLNLLGNKLGTLPIELAGANFATGLLLYHNQLDFDYGTAGNLFKTPGDIKVLFEEAGLSYPKLVSDSVYALAIINRIRARAKAKNWQGAIDYAEKAKKLAPAIYKVYAPWNIIGLSRFNLKDYKGAIADFDQYIEAQRTTGLGVRYSTSTELEYKLKADSALNNPAGMAKTYVQTGSMKNFIQALSLAKRINDKVLYKQLAQKILTMTRKNIEWYGKEDHYYSHEHYMVIKGQYPDDVLIRHALLLLITGNAKQATDTLKLSNKNHYRPGDNDYPYKNLLLAAGNYLVKPSAFEQLKTALADTIAETGPILKDEFTFLPFTDWLPASNYSSERKKDLLSLYNIALTPLPVQHVNLTKTNSNDTKANRINLLYERFSKVRNGALEAKKEWQTIVDLADEMIRIDSAAYKRFADWYLTGIARFKTGDYQGAVNDFDRYLKQNPHDFYDYLHGAKYKVQAHLALGQTLAAAQTFENLDKSRGPKTNGLQEAAVIYKGAGNNAKFKTLINAALKRSKKNLDSVTVDIDYQRGGFALDHAELLIIAGKHKEAVKLLNTYTAPYNHGNLAVREYLLNVVNVLNGKKSAEEATKRITEFMAGQFKFNVWDFTMFNRWIKYSGINKNEQQELLALQELIDEKPKAAKE